jgi:hypothetical protein
MCFILQWFHFLRLYRVIGRMTSEWWIGEDLEESSHALQEVLIWHLPGRTEENLSQDNQWLDWDFSRHFLKTSLEYHCCTRLLNKRMSWVYICVTQWFILCPRYMLSLLLKHVEDKQAVKSFSQPTDTSSNSFWGPQKCHSYLIFILLWHTV